jgi:hypothetical protein
MRKFNQLFPKMKLFKDKMNIMITNYHNLEKQISQITLLITISLTFSANINIWNILRKIEIQNN